MKDIDSTELTRLNVPDVHLHIEDPKWIIGEKKGFMISILHGTVNWRVENSDTQEVFKCGVGMYFGHLVDLVFDTLGSYDVVVFGSLQTGESFIRTFRRAIEVLPPPFKWGDPGVTEIRPRVDAKDSFRDHSHASNSSLPRPSGPGTGIHIDSEPE